MMSLYVTLHCESWWGFHVNLIVPGHFHGILFVQYFQWAFVFIFSSLLYLLIIKKSWQCFAQGENIHFAHIMCT